MRHRNSAVETRRGPLFEAIDRISRPPQGSDREALADFIALQMNAHEAQSRDGAVPQPSHRLGGRLRYHEGRPIHAQRRNIRPSCPRRQALPDATDAMAGEAVEVAPPFDPRDELTNESEAQT
jgi:hypothetical protein